MHLINLILLYLILGLVSATSVSVSLHLNTTTASWNEAINASGYVKDSLGNPWQGNVSVYVDGGYACSTNSSASGFYNCSFTTPDDLGQHNAQAFALSSSVVIGKSSIVNFWTIYAYGSEKEYGSVAAITFPVIVQQISGKINTVAATLKLWR